MLTNTRTEALRHDLRKLSGLMSGLLTFAGLTVFAEGLYNPIKRLVVGLPQDAGTALHLFHDQVMPLLPALLLLGALNEARRLFARMGDGELLAPATATGVRHTGDWVLAAAITAAFVDAVASALHPGWALLGGLAAIGLGLRSLGDVLDHAAAIKADHDQIV
ncbi:MAG: hypothetical protein WCO82_03470 [Sphingomonadales bacterium]